MCARCKWWESSCVQLCNTQYEDLTRYCKMFTKKLCNVCKWWVSACVQLLPLGLAEEEPSAAAALLSVQPPLPTGKPPPGARSR